MEENNIYNENAECATCGEVFERKTLKISGLIFRLSQCQKCIDEGTKRVAQQKATAAYLDSEDHWRSICPAIYRDTDISDPRLNKAAIKAALEWHPRSVRGLGLIGTTGAGKTRCAFLALKKAHDISLKCDSISHNSFSRIAMDAYSGSNDERGAARDRLKRLRRADVLLIDDLGKPPSTERADSELEELIEYRTSAALPIIFTANGSGSWLIKRFGDDRGEPLVRRLAEFCSIITL